jgi:hypothetical protein
MVGWFPQVLVETSTPPTSRELKKLTLEADEIEEPATTTTNNNNNTGLNLEHDHELFLL